MNLAGREIWVGQLGQRAEILQQLDGDRLLIELDNAQTMVIPATDIGIQPDGTLYLASLSKLPSTTPEQPLIGETRAPDARLRVTRRIESEEQVIDEAVQQGEVDVVRVPINRLIDKSPEIRQEGDTTVIPVVGEVLVVEKRLVLQEEVRITRRQGTARKPQTVNVQRQTVDVQQQPVQ